MRFFLLFLFFQSLWTQAPNTILDTLPKTAEAKFVPVDIHLKTLKAFPSLYGEGAGQVSGGRDGIKFFITSLSNSSSAKLVAAEGNVEAPYYTGTLLGALNLGEPAQIIPRVSGNIDNVFVDIDGRGGKSVKDHKTYHGHLAPKGGLALINSRIDLANTQDFVFRFLTIRDGTHAKLATDDVIFLNRSSNIILDHCSLAWAGDENLSHFPGTIKGIVYKNIIVQRTLFGQARDKHNRGALMGTVQTNGGDIITNFHLNLWSGVFARTPNVVGTKDTKARVYNQVIYDWKGRTINLLRGATLDAAYEYFKPGPNTVQVANSMLHQYQNIGGGPPSIFTKGNYVLGYLEDDTINNAEKKGIWSAFDNYNATILPKKWFRTTPLPIDSDVGYRPISALATYTSVVSKGEVGNNRATDYNGNTIRYHDIIDDFYLVAVKNGTDATLDEQEFIHPKRESNPPYPDENWNGIDDDFESLHGIKSSKQVITQWKINGKTILNTAGYNAFEIWSAFKAGDFD